MLLIGWTQKSETIVLEYDDYLEPGSEIVVECDPLRSDELDSLDLASFDQVIILSQSRNQDGDEQTTASETILILLLLRQLLEEQERQPKLITEILESANGALVRHVGGQDVIVSNQLVSTLAAQLSEDPTLRSVFDMLFSEEGSEFYLKPISLYCEPGSHRFATLMDLAQQRAEVAIGVRQEAVVAKQGVTLIPAKGLR